MGNHIITLAVQAHNGEQSELHNSKLKTNIKRDNKSVRSRNVISFCRCKGLGFAHNAFDRSNVMLALLPKCKFCVKDIILSCRVLFCNQYLSPVTDLAALISNRVISDPIKKPDISIITSVIAG